MKWLKQTSLRVRLIFTLSLTALVIWLASTAVAWFQVRKEVNDVFDAQQILLAQRLASANLHNMLIARAPHDVNKQLKKVRHYDDDALAFAIFNHRGDLLLSDGNNGENFILHRTVVFQSVLSVKMTIVGGFFGCQSIKENGLLP